MLQSRRTLKPVRLPASRSPRALAQCEKRPNMAVGHRRTRGCGISTRQTTALVKTRAFKSNVVSIRRLWIGTNISCPPFLRS